MAVPPSQLGGPVPLATEEQRFRFARGQILFDSVYDPSTGLGPLFNARSCSSCHYSPVLGGSGEQKVMHATAFRNGVCDELRAEGGPVVQVGVTPALHDALGINQEPIPAGATAVGFRTPPSIWGSGLLDAVPDTEILARADPNDRDGDGVAGRPNYTDEGALGKFGRKADGATLWDFVTRAYVMEMGLTNQVY